MRKIDYNLLSLSIGQHLKLARVVANDSRASEHEQLCAKGAAAALFNVAHEFAASASVDKTAFLKACGIDT